MLGFLLLSPDVTVGRGWLVLAIVLASSAIYITTSVLWNAWPLFAEADRGIMIDEVVSSEGAPVFLLRCPNPPSIGSVLALTRVRESVHTSAGLIRVTRTAAVGTAQAEPLWITPLHLEEITSKSVSIANLQVSNAIPADLIARVIDERTRDAVEREIGEHLRRGE